MIIVTSWGTGVTDWPDEMRFILDLAFSGFGIFLSALAISLGIVATCIILIRLVKPRMTFGPMSFIISFIFFVALCFPVSSLRAGFVFKDKLSDFKETAVSLIPESVAGSLENYAKEDCEKLIEKVEEKIPGIKALTEKADYEISSPIATVESIYKSVNSYLSSLIWKSLLWIAVIFCAGSVILYRTCSSAVVPCHSERHSIVHRDRGYVRRQVERRRRY